VYLSSRVGWILLFIITSQIIQHVGVVATEAHFLANLVELTPPYPSEELAARKCSGRRFHKLVRSTFASPSQEPASPAKRMADREGMGRDMNDRGNPDRYERREPIARSGILEAFVWERCEVETRRKPAIFFDVNHVSYNRT
jgi:hypothetical protein